MARSLVRRGIADLTPRPERASFLSPMAPEAAAAKLDVALHGERKPHQLTLTAQRGHFRGNLQGPSFWVQSKSAGWNLMERRVEGTLLPNAGSTEVRTALRMRPSAIGSVMALLATLVTLTIVAGGVVLAAEAVWTDFAHALFWLLFSTLTALWVLLAGSVYAMRRLASDAEQATVEFLTTVLEAPTSFR